MLYDFVRGDGTTQDDQATGVAIDSAGRIVVSASGAMTFRAMPDQRYMAALTLRLLPDGRFDPTYQSGPRSVPGVTANGDSVWSHMTDVAVGADDAVVGVGFWEWGGADDPTAVRFLSVGGQPDPFFGSAGIARVAVTGEVQATGVAVDPTDGSYVLCGSQGSQTVLVARLRASDGAPDPRFGGAGYVHRDVPGMEDVYVTGAAPAGGAAQAMAVWRLTPAGALDPSFGGAAPSPWPGVFVTTEGAAAAGLDVALDAAGRVVVAGHGTSATGLDVAVFRLR